MLTLTCSSFVTRSRVWGEISLRALRMVSRRVVADCAAQSGFKEKQEVMFINRIKHVTAARTEDSWQRRLRREVGWLFIAKMVALLLLWGLFFSAPHRLRVEGDGVADRLAVAKASTDL
jgi:hypothetical protein